MSRLTLKYFDSAIAAAKLSGVANSFGSLVFEWLCIATTILCFSANGTTRFATSSVVEAVMISAPSALRHLEAAVDFLVGEVVVGAVVEGVDRMPADVELP